MLYFLQLGRIDKVYRNSNGGKLESVARFARCYKENEILCYFR